MASGITNAVKNPTNRMITYSAAITTMNRQARAALTRSPLGTSSVTSVVDPGFECFRPATRPFVGLLIVSNRIGRTRHPGSGELIGLAAFWVFDARCGQPSARRQAWLR
jgi:hypothetical protein